MTDFSVVRQLIGTLSPISNSGFSVASQLSGTLSPERISDFCVSPHDRPIAHLLSIIYTTDADYAIGILDKEYC
jgi:hypothetical protein